MIEIENRLKVRLGSIQQSGEAGGDGKSSQQEQQRGSQ